MKVVVERGGMLLIIAFGAYTKPFFSGPEDHRIRGREKVLRFYNLGSYGRMFFDFTVSDRAIGLMSVVASTLTDRR